MEIYNIQVNKRDGSTISLDEYRGKVILVVNTAINCGLTPQYEALEEIYKKYQGEGLEILDFPCNQFGNQAPGTGEEIHTFCKGRFGITFPQFEKIHVNGKETSPLYTYLKKYHAGILGSGIKWNFTKFLIDRNGTVVGRYAPTDKPEKLVEKIEELLKMAENT